MKYLIPILGLLSGCVDSYTPPQHSLRRHVFIDDSFQLEERFDVIFGIDSWHNHVPEIELTHGFLSRTDMYEMARRDDTRYEAIYIYNSACDFEMDPNALAQEVTISTRTEVICTRDLSLVFIIPIHAIISHEIGHAFGLKHDHEFTVMAPTADQMSLDITPADVKQMREVWDLVP